MMTEFVSIQLTREELQEVHAALVQRAILEDDLRQEWGQEPVERRALLEKFEMLLGERAESLHALDHALNDELWEYAWYTFTDAWAHFRAQQEVEKELGQDKKAVGQVTFEQLVDTRYQKKFEAYVDELAMDETQRKTVIRSPQDTKGSG